VHVVASCDGNAKELNMTTTSRTGLGALLNPANCTFVLIDHQPFQFAGLQSHDPGVVLNNVVGLAKTARLFNVPTILTTVVQDRGGFLPAALQSVFPDQKPIDRTTINTWEDKRVVDAVAAHGRKKLVIAALWTEICLAMPVIQALGEGYEVYIVTDASGGVSVEAHERAVQRLIQAGAIPMTWMAVMSELQRDWAREATIPGVASIITEHGGATGINFGWEMQLLGQKA
jgi:nicotinamidase-related amidase